MVFGETDKVINDGAWIRVNLLLTVIHSLGVEGGKQLVRIKRDNHSNNLHRKKEKKRKKKKNTPSRVMCRVSPFRAFFRSSRYL